MIEQQRVTERVSRLRAIEPPQEQPVDVRRYVNALRGSWLLIAAIVIPVTAGVLALSLNSPKTYSSTATMLLDESPDTASADAARQLATIQTLLTTRNVLQEAARKLPGESAQTLAGKVTAAVDPNANIVRINASAESPRAAARIANAVTTVFLSRQRTSELRRLEACARAARGRTGAASRHARLARGDALIKERLTELSISEANAARSFSSLTHARVSARPVSPRTVRNGAFAFVAALFIAVIVALGRAHIAPRVGGPEGAGPTDRATDPDAGPAGATSSGRSEPGRARVLRVPGRRREEPAPIATPAHSLRDERLCRRGQGKRHRGPRPRTRARRREDVARRRRPASAHSGAALRDGACRRPRGDPGLGAARRRGRRGGRDHGTTCVCLETRDRQPLGSGHRRCLASVVVSGDALEVLFRELARSAFSYVLIAGPPLLGPVDSRLWVRGVEAVLIATQPERLTPTDAVELRERLDGIGANILGHVVVGGASRGK